MFGHFKEKFSLGNDIELMEKGDLKKIENFDVTNFDLENALYTVKFDIAGHSIQMEKKYTSNTEFGIMEFLTTRGFLNGNELASSDLALIDMVFGHKIDGLLQIRIESYGEQNEEKLREKYRNAMTDIIIGYSK